jgi:hypothetical protein
MDTVEKIKQLDEQIKALTKERDALYNESYDAVRKLDIEVGKKLVGKCFKVKYYTDSPGYHYLRYNHVGDNGMCTVVHEEYEDKPYYAIHLSDFTPEYEGAAHRNEEINYIECSHEEFNEFTRVVVSKMIGEQI